MTPRKPETVNWMHNGKLYVAQSYWNKSQGAWMWLWTFPEGTTQKERVAATREFHKARRPVQ